MIRTIHYSEFDYQGVRVSLHLFTRDGIREISRSVYHPGEHSWLWCTQGPRHFKRTVKAIARNVRIIQAISKG
jgi:hypothetical protein